MGVNCMPKTVTPGPSAPESSTLTSRLPSHPGTVSRRNLRAVSDTKALKKKSIVLIRACRVRRPWTLRTPQCGERHSTNLTLNRTELNPIETQ